MKRTISVILTFLLIATLCSCGGKPANMSDGMYQIGINALNVADQYIAGEISGSAAYERIEEYYTQAEAQIESDSLEVDSDTLVGTEYSDDTFVENDLFILDMDFMDAADGEGSMSDIIEDRDNLAEDLGK